MFRICIIDLNTVADNFKGLIYTAICKTVAYLLNVQKSRKIFKRAKILQIRFL